MAPGYPTQEDAEAQNAGVTATYTLVDPGPIGVRRVTGGDPLAAGGPSVGPACYARRAIVR